MGGSWGDSIFRLILTFNARRVETRIVGILRSLHVLIIHWAHVFHRYSLVIRMRVELWLHLVLHLLPVKTLATHSHLLILLVHKCFKHFEVIFLENSHRLHLLLLVSFILMHHTRTLVVLLLLNHNLLMRLLHNWFKLFYLKIDTLSSHR